MLLRRARDRLWSQLRRHSRASRANADAQLRSSEQACVVSEGAITRIDIAHLPANQPTEDFYATAKCLSSDAFLFGVFDGHCGNACSRYISTHLFDYVSAGALKRHIIMDLPLKDRLQWLYTNGDPLDEKFREYTGIVSAGSCAVLGHLRGVDLHVANVGDSAAVLGVHNQGTISAMHLSKPHCVDNAEEVERVKTGHPSYETNNIMIGGRLFGELFPLRAFGDVRYKWPVKQQMQVFGLVGDSIPSNLSTPPYLTALPEVLYRRLTPNDRFLVIATDGLWDCLDPDTAVRLVNDHTLGTQTLNTYVPIAGTTLAQVHEELKLRQEGTSKKPLDENSATHLLRHALGGSGSIATQYLRLIELLQLPPHVARRYRDDITIIVVHFDQKYLEAFQEAAGPSQA